MVTIPWALNIVVAASLCQDFLDSSISGCLYVLQSLESPSKTRCFAALQSGTTNYGVTTSTALWTKSGLSTFLRRFVCSGQRSARSLIHLKLPIASDIAKILHDPAWPTNLDAVRNRANFEPKMHPWIARGHVSA